VKPKDHDFGWGAVVNFKKLENPKENPLNAEPTYIAEVLLIIATDGATSRVTDF
jgi:ATP-dependent RNA helicase DOB1